MSEKERYDELIEDITTNGWSEAEIKIAMLMSIASSLAIIADKLSEKGENE
jgi:hypothetical protein